MQNQRDEKRNQSFCLRKHVYAICEKIKRLRSACASAQSNHRLCCLLPGYYNAPNFYIRNCRPLPCFCAGRFVSDLVANPEDRFSRHVARLFSFLILLDVSFALFRKARGFPRACVYLSPSFVLCSF